MTTTRRQFLGRAAAATAVVATHPVLTAGSADAARRPRPELTGNQHRWRELEQSYDVTWGLYLPPGVADGPVSFVRCQHPTWQTGQPLWFHMHGNGHTYRAHDELGGIWASQWCHGPTGDLTYSGIASVMHYQGELWGFTHDERGYGATATIGAVRSPDLLGYAWEREGIDLVEGADLQPDGFRGASGPSVVDTGDGLVMLYTNRFGNGRHDEIWRATADHPAGPWQVHGPVITEDTNGPHFYAQAPSVVWSTARQQWLCIYSTDTAVRWRPSRNLRRWGRARTLDTKPQQWQQTSGYRRWYATLLDPSQQHSNIVGDSGILSEHWIDVADPTDRWPSRTDWQMA